MILFNNFGNLYEFAGLRKTSAGSIVELNINISLGDNVIPHTLGRKVTFLTAFYEGQRLELDWRNADPDTQVISTTNIYIPASPAEYINVTLYIQ